MKLRDWSFTRLKHDEAGTILLESDRLRVMNVTRGTELAEKVEVAKSGGRRSKGLLGRKGLEPGEGLWIVPCEAIHTFFMQFDIDLIYLDRKLRIKKVASGVPPWRMSACLSAYSVLELPSGAVHESQSRPGDMVEFSPLRESAGSPRG
jgi:uncharacterized membrane protein (UPF0127 family)